MNLAVVSAEPEPAPKASPQQRLSSKTREKPSSVGFFAGLSAIRGPMNFCFRLSFEFRYSLLEFFDLVRTVDSIRISRQRNAQSPAAIWPIDHRPDTMVGWIAT